jgi:hypothetical protein
LTVKRVISQPWYKPILQVGATGFELIPADPFVPFPVDSPKTQMTVRFKAPQDGELFLYVNDVYSGFLPAALILGESQNNADGSWRHAYGNNSGKAEVKIEPLPAEFGD